MTRWVLVGLLTLSCGQRGPTCVSDAACSDTQACLQGRCTEVECRADAQCPLETTCSLETYTCDSGCVTSDDCFVGDRCDVLTNTCVPRTCSDTQLDCEFGQRCDRDSGRCIQDPEPHCKRCFNDATCGEAGACGQLIEGGTSRCFLECVPEAFDPCPSGMQCTWTSEGLFRCVGFCDGF